MSEQESVYITTEQLAFRWVMDSRSLANMRLRGDGPPYTKPGGRKNSRVRYLLEDVIAYERANRKGAARA